jgi:hypothetical protein
MQGRDPSGDPVDLRTDEQRLLRNRPYEPYRRVASAGLTGAWATYYTCPANSIAKAEVILGQELAATDVAISLRVQGQGQNIAVPVYSDAPGPAWNFTLEGGDLIEAVRVAGGGGSIYINIELYSTGDVNTGV